MTHEVKSAEVTLPSEREVRVERSFRAPREPVYEAYTRPELMRRWLLGPPGWTMPVCEMDVRVGGRFRWRWRSDADGKEFGFEGEFQEVRPLSLLRHTERYDPGDIGDTMGDGEAIVTVSMEEANGVTTVTTVVAYASQQDRDAALSTGMTDGMEASYRLLDELMAAGATARR